MATTWRIHLFHALFGGLFGAVLVGMGFDDWGEVHKMFLLTSLRLFLSFALAVGLSMAVYRLLGSARASGRRPFHPGIIPGGLLFGVGWAVTGACPSIALVTVGEGKLLALWTLGGVVLGTWAFARLQPKLFRWDTGSCER